MFTNSPNTLRLNITNPPGLLPGYVLIHTRALA